MTILAIRTDSGESEVTILQDRDVAAHKRWEAGRGLSVQLHRTIEDLLNELHYGWDDISGVVVFKGPGSFTGLRIGMTVGNTVAFSLGVPVVSSAGDSWLDAGIQRLMAGEDETVALPEYGAEANISTPRK